MEVGELMPPDHTFSHSDNESLHLWCAYPEDALTAAAAHECMSILSEDERERWQRFRFDHHRREYLTTRVLVRTALSHWHPTAVEAWRFQTSAHGKPRVDPDCGLRFNLSNSPSLVICLIARGFEVGADAEPYEHAEKIATLAPTVFSPQELVQLEALHGQEKLDRALSLWTLKEAYIKATGVGMSRPLKEFSFLFGGTEGIRLEFDPLLDDQPVQR
ncbi:MAG: 4'-phosphopantetheinyl transferase superfamily protein, partial [Terracidiphilus sp.]